MIIQVTETERDSRLDAVIAMHCSDISRAQIKKLIDNGEVQLNGSVCPKPGRKCQIGDRIEIVLPEPADTGIPAPQAGIPFDIVYEDAHLFVIDKPAGLVVHPGAGHLDHTLVNALLAIDPHIAEIGDPERPGIVHRIDAETSGLLIVARTPKAHEMLTQMFAKHDVYRIYRAICYAPHLPQNGRFDTPYGRHPTQRIKYSSRFDAPKRAITDYCVIDRNAQGFALVTCRLETGRTHQVRVHLSEHHAPILADPLYASGPAANHKAIHRLALHAQRLMFNHPITGEPCDFNAPYPADFLAALEKLHLTTDQTNFGVLLLKSQS